MPYLKNIVSDITENVLNFVLQGISIKILCTILLNLIIFVKTKMMHNFLKCEIQLDMYYFIFLIFVDLCNV